ncbi:786_t:CDS:2 [Scutellospora calospora]|uniref:786_t:CDS:1 n=1 Tax=Scutellospora calospora TaxID=85575 RepID=A0ACA9JX35_9GLOM|nr:786_t:CDS:2 [Scutellospora calospora]
MTMKVIAFNLCWDPLCILRARSTINHWTFTFGTRNRNSLTAKNSLISFVSLIDNFKNISYYGDGSIDSIRNVALDKVQTILTNAYNKGIPYYAEGILHQVAHRTYQEMIKKINEDKKNEYNLLMKRLTEEMSKYNDTKEQLEKQKEIISLMDKKINQILANMKIEFPESESSMEKLNILFRHTIHK